MILLGGAGTLGAPVADWAQSAWAWVRPDSGPVTKVVVVEESGKRPPIVAAVVLGPTSDLLRKADKWRLFDKDDLPTWVKPVVDKLLEANTPPFVLLFHGDSYIIKPLPATDAEFAVLLQQNGGF